MIWQAILPWLPLMVLLMGLSAFFSGCEAALFSLRSKDRRALARGPIGGRVAARLLEDPETLLSAVLFWNLLINMTYFAIASIVGTRLEASGTAAVFLFTVCSLVLLIFFSEMLPKSIAVLSPRRFSRIVGPPLALSVRVIQPILPLVRAANTASRRLLWPGFEEEKDLEVNDIERAIELGTGDAALAARERTALRQLVQLASIRVDEWLIPRSHLKLDRAPISLNSFSDGLPDNGYVLIAEPESEEIISYIGIRSLRPSQMDDLSAATEPVVFIPWSATVADAFESLQAADRNVAAIVNEYGETIGVLTIDLILEGILKLHAGRPNDVGGDAHFEVIEPGVWRVSGMMSVRRLAEHLGATAPESRNVTVAGLMQEENERLPRINDICRWDRFSLQVVEATGRGMVRIEIREASADEST